MPTHGICQNCLKQLTEQIADHGPEEPPVDLNKLAQAGQRQGVVKVPQGSAPVRHNGGDHPALGVVRARQTGPLPPEGRLQGYPA
jgi:hypothetical protein